MIGSENAQLNLLYIHTKKVVYIYVILKKYHVDIYQTKSSDYEDVMNTWILTQNLETVNDYSEYGITGEPKPHKINTKIT